MKHHQAHRDTHFTFTGTSAPRMGCSSNRRENEDIRPFPSSTRISGCQRTSESNLTFATTTSASALAVTAGSATTQSASAVAKRFSMDSFWLSPDGGGGSGANEDDHKGPT